MSGVRRFSFGMMYLAIVFLAAAYALAMNRGTFEHNIAVEVVADRAGLTLAPGARVKFRGVDVGRVKSIQPAVPGARIRVDLFEQQVRFVPADVTAQIVPPTAFGAKYVNLESGSAGAHRPITAGTQVRASHVTTEFNDAFENLTKVMQVARPDRLNRALTAGATVLNGQGQDLGELLTALQRYLAVFNSSLPELSHDLRAVLPVVKVYDRSASDLVKVLDNFGEVSETVSDRRSALDDLLSSTSTVSARGDRFFDTNQPGIARVVKLYDPVTGALARYAPELPCTFGGVVDVNEYVERAIGGTRPGYHTYSKFLPSEAPYKPRVNLPVVHEDRGPRCYGLPIVDEAESFRKMPTFDVGADPDPEPESSAGGLAGTFFGSLGDGAKRR